MIKKIVDEEELGIYIIIIYYNTYIITIRTFRSESSITDQFRRTFPSATIPPKMHMLEDHTINWVRAQCWFWPPWWTGCGIHSRTLQQPNANICICSKRSWEAEECYEGTPNQCHSTKCRGTTTTCQKKKDNSTRGAIFLFHIYLLTSKVQIVCPIAKY